MDNKEFYKLYCELQGIYLKLNYLQAKYRRETGKDFVPGQGFERKPDKGER